jgi:outer membrane immunogenic protein
MRRGVLASVTILALGLAAGSASAADLKPVYKAPPAPAPVVDPWTGFYVGVNGGYSWGPWDSTSIAPIFPGGTGLINTASPEVNGWVAGIQAGYNWRINSTWLAGLEADIQATGERDTSTGSLTLTAGASTVTLTENNEWKFPWFATFRGRVGALIDPSTLIYLTGGAAVGRFEFTNVSTATVTLAAVTATASVATSGSTTRWGGAVGAGVERKFTPNWSAKAEFLYLDFGTHTFLAGTGFDTSIRLNDFIARAGVNYRF